MTPQENVGSFNSNKLKKKKPNFSPMYEKTMREILRGVLPPDGTSAQLLQLFRVHSTTASDTQILIFAGVWSFFEGKPSPASLRKLDLAGSAGEKCIKVQYSREKAVKRLQSFPQMNSQKIGAR